MRIVHLTIFSREITVDFTLKVQNIKKNNKTWNTRGVVWGCKIIWLEYSSTRLPREIFTDERSWERKQFWKYIFQPLWNIPTKTIVKSLFEHRSTAVLERQYLWIVYFIPHQITNDYFILIFVNSIRNYQAVLCYYCFWKTWEVATSNIYFFDSVTCLRILCQRV